MSRNHFVLWRKTDKGSAKTTILSKFGLTQTHSTEGRSRTAGLGVICHQPEQTDPLSVLNNKNSQMFYCVIFCVKLFVFNWFADRKWHAIPVGNQSNRYSDLLPITRVNPFHNSLVSDTQRYSICLSQWQIWNHRILTNRILSNESSLPVYCRAVSLKRKKRLLGKK